MRELSDTFMNDLLKPEGALYPVLMQLRRDHTLMLAIRENYLNVYYRGGNILRLVEHGRGCYLAFFDEQYNKFEQSIPCLPTAIEIRADAEKWVTSFPKLKNIMDEYFSVYGKAEREFQQLVARENNFSSISNESEYFISDIEVTEQDPGARFDMTAIRWPASKRKAGKDCRAALIEMKYGDGALDGDAGLLKHLRDMDALISHKDRYTDLLCSMECHFDQLDRLGLLKFNKGKSEAKVKLDVEQPPELIFIIANHNPRSPKLGRILANPEIQAYAASKHFDLRFYVASFCGYALHTKCMHSLTEFRKLL